MSKKRRPFRWAGVLIFVVLVAITGFALNRKGYWDNPFDHLMNNSGEGHDSSGEREPPGGLNREAMPRDSEAGNPFRPEGGKPGGASAGLDAIAWSQIGGVLFDLWFLFAATAVVILTARLAGYVVKTLAV